MLSLALYISFSLQVNVSILQAFYKNPWILMSNINVFIAVYQLYDVFNETTDLWLNVFKTL